MRRLQLLRDPKRLFPIIFGSVAGILILTDMLYPDVAGLRWASTELLRWVVVIGAFAVIIGVVNVLLQHITRLRRRDARWPYSIALLIGLIIPPGVALSLYLSRTAVYATISPLFQDIVRWVYTPLSISLLALLTFFSITASIHALRSKNREAVLIVSVAILMLIAQLPLLGSFPVVGDITQWIHNYIALAGARGLILGAAIGAVVASVRILLGLDRPYLDR